MTPVVDDDLLLPPLSQQGFFKRESQTHDLTISVIFGFTWVTKRLKETVIDLHKKSTFTLTKF